MIKSFEKPVRCQCRNISNNRICLKKCRTLYMVEKNCIVIITVSIIEMFLRQRFNHYGEDLNSEE